MDGGQLHRLGRRLVELSRGTTGSSTDPAMTAGEEAVIEDVLIHPGSAVREVAERTGFAQGHVSASIAKLQQRRLVTTAADPADRRRTLIEANPKTVSAITTRASRTIEPTLQATLGIESTARVTKLLDELAELLLD